MNKTALIIKLKLIMTELEEDELVINSDNIKLVNSEGLKFLDTVKDNSIDLVLTDPPYITSRKTGMDSHAKLVSQVDKSGKNCKTADQWSAYKLLNGITNDKKKNNYIKYGTIYGKKYAVKTDYGEWDKEFTMEVLEEFIKKYYIKLRDGGSIIIWFDIWKITPLKDLLEKYFFNP